MFKGIKKIAKMIERVAAALEERNRLIQEQIDTYNDLAAIYTSCIGAFEEITDELDMLSVAVAQLQRNYLAVDENDY